MPWICDGVPKDGKNYPQAIPGGHSTYENSGPDCNICGLPQEAMIPAKSGAAGMPSTPTTVMTTKIGGGGKGQKSKLLIPGIIALAILVFGAGAYGLYKLIFSNSKPDPSPTTSATISPTSSGGLISSQAKNSTLISQGEQILLDKTAEKENGASSFSSQNWTQAESDYQQAANNGANDPEAKIYLNNAQAQQATKRLTIAVVVPISNDPNSAKEVLRGVAKAQEEFNQNATDKLQVVIVDDIGGIKTKTIAQDLVNSQEIIGVIGHGIDPFSEQAIQEYETAKLAILSPRTTSVSDGSQPTLKTISMAQKTDELLSSYLQGVGKTLTEYAAKTNPSPKSVIFFNSASPYSKQLKDEIAKALPQVQGQVVKEFDLNAGVDPASALSEATAGGAKVAFIALNKGKVTEAIAIAQANADAGYPLMLLGGDELYGPEILIKGGDAIKGMILAVPWAFQPSDSFAADAIKSWKGRVSWRTATAYDATKVLAETASQNPTRSDVQAALSQGVALSGQNTDFSIFDEVPLVEAKPGGGGPTGSQYEFSPIP